MSSAQAANLTETRLDPASERVDAPTVQFPDQPINILLVDDEPKNLTVLESILENPGYRLVKAQSADEALLALVREDFALIVLDIQMPGMTGFELAQMIKQRRRSASIPIIFLTAHFGEDQHMLEGYETGAVDYLLKPVNSTVLRSKVAVFAELNRKTRDSVLAQVSLLAEVRERQRIQDQLHVLNQELEQRVAERTSELLEANSALSRSEERLHRAQQAGEVGTWEWDLTTGAGTWSDAARLLLDLPDVNEPISHDVWTSRIHPEDRERAVQKLNEARTTGTYRDEFRILGDDRHVKWVEFVGAADGRQPAPQRMRGAVRNITARKEMELELKETDRRKDQFLAMLGHELRNPLAPIRNAVTILNKIGIPHPELRWCQEVLDRQVQQLTRIVDDLLDVSRVSRGKIQLKMERLDLSLALQHALESCGPQIEARRHQLLVSEPPAPLFVQGDLVRLSQVVANLLINAVKYTDEGGVIRLTLAEDPAEPDHAVISVADTGRGIAPDVIANLFELFYQADSNIDRSDGGLGIGLSLARSLVQMHRGRIEARSEGLGRGSEFRVVLPRDQMPADEVRSTDTRAERPAAAKRKMLVVDDNRDSARSMGMLLGMLGHDILLAHDGLEAVETALREQPDVVLLDIGLPGLNGYEACRQMRAQGLTEQLIFAVTGYGQDDDRKLCLDAGFDNHFVKPVSLSTLEASLARAAAVK